MARDYKRAANSAAGERAPGSWLSFLTGLGIGLVGAVIVYWWMQNGGPPPVSQSSESAVSPTTTEPPVETPAELAVPPAPTDAEQLSLPKFDFYKILPEIEVKVPEEEIAEPAADEVNGEKPPPARDPGATYLLQVGSFQNFDDADQAKAQLALQGVQAAIQRVVINGQDVWHRVHVGPFSDLNEAQQMRTRLSQIGVNAIVLKLGGGQ